MSSTTPYLRVGRKVFQGHYEQLIGSELLLAQTGEGVLSRV